MFRKAFLSMFAVLALSSVAAAGIPPVGVQDEGGAESKPVFTINCVGPNIECTHSGKTMTITESGSGGSGDNITANSSAIDTTADFADGTYIDVILTDGGAGGPDTITFKHNYALTLAGDPTLAVDECTFFSDLSGGGIICEGSTADTNEQLYRLPDANGADTTEYFFVTGSAIDPAANVESILGAADYAAIRGLLDLEAGTDFYSITAADAAFEGELDNSAGLAAALDDETGTGAAVFGTAPTFTTSITSTLVITDLIDTTGAADIDYGSADVTDHTFITDGTGTAEIVLPAGAIDGTEILDDTVAFADVDHTITLAGNPALAASQCFWSSIGIICEGSSADTIETLLTFANPTSSDKTITFPNLTGTVALSTNNLSLFAATTSAQLAGVLSDETGSGGGFVRATSPTLTTPVLGAATATSITMTSLALSDGLIDGVGAVDIDYGSADVTDHTFVSDGGTAIIDGSITAGGAENYIQFTAGYTADPCTDSGSSEVPINSIFHNTTANELCWCSNSGVDLRTKDFSTACF